MKTVQYVIIHPNSNTLLILVEDSFTYLEKEKRNVVLNIN